MSHASRRQSSRDGRGSWLLPMESGRVAYAGSYCTDRTLFVAFVGLRACRFDVRAVLEFFIGKAQMERIKSFANNRHFASSTFEVNGILPSVAFGDNVLTSRYERQSTRLGNPAYPVPTSTGARSTAPATEEVPGGVFGSIPYMPRMQPFFCVDGWRAAVLPGEGARQHPRAVPRMPIQPQSPSWARGPRPDRGCLR